MILVVAPYEDAHTQAVRHCLARMGAEVTGLDLAEFPQQAQVALSFDARRHCYERLLSDYEREIDLAGCGAVWWRQPHNLILHPELTDQVYRSFAYVECQAALTGLWLGLDVVWVNHPLRSEEAQRKAYQLKIVQQCGFEIPATLITNNPNRARAFVLEHGANHTTYRAFSTSARAWREAELVEPQQLALLDNVCYAPVVFQEVIPAEAEVRIVAIGSRCFAVQSAISGGHTSLNLPATFALPAELVHQIGLLMQHLGLVYALIVMRMTTSGQLVFQEIDPTGSWLDLEEMTEMPITQAIADLLLEADEQG